MIVGFHKEGRIILATSTLIAALSLIAIWYFKVSAPFNYLLIAFILVFLYLFYQFFRVPKRTPVTGDDLIVCPCDGKVVVIEEVVEGEVFDEPYRQISIFMSPLNVHINWFPVAGKVSYSAYHPGKFLVAWHPKSSTDNERTTVVVDNSKGRVLMRQIAGAVARRIICYAEKGNTALQSGEMGFIKFGSRVDVFIPLSADVQVNIDDVVTGNQTILAKW